jgi:hypothetical protein
MRIGVLERIDADDLALVVSFTGDQKEGVVKSEDQSLKEETDG